ncbi:MAG: MBL fold metallo-hydrolase [Deltaproteobacteria bacterium]|nr:MAG: MBL fold metallo-hydrolase [Deltaproteobacteria bacterium]
MVKAFASAGDTQNQRAVLTPLADGVYGYISDFDPNTGVIVGDDACLAIDCRATPSLAREMIADIQAVTEQPITSLFLTHYHAVRVLGRAAFHDVTEVIASANTASLIEERGEQDFASEVRRFPRLFQGVEEVPGLTQPTLTFETSMTYSVGGREVLLAHPGRGHTKGDSVVWLEQEKVLFAGDLMEDHCALYCGDAYIQEWRDTLNVLASYPAEVVVPGRGAVIRGAAKVQEAIALTRGFLDDLLRLTSEAIEGGFNLKATFDHVYASMTPTYGTWPIYEHCIPFNVSRAFDELQGIAEPTVWTAQRDQDMWSALQG